MDSGTKSPLTNIEADMHLLELINSVINSVHTSLNAEQIGNTTLEALDTHFHPLSSCLHTADAIQQALHLLSFRVPLESEHTFNSSYIPYDKQVFIAQAHLHREPLFIENVPDALASGIIATDDPLIMDAVRGYMTVPLWFGDQFEGTLTVAFSKDISVYDSETRAIIKCGVHIASALAHARLHLIVENERTRLRIILDQLPEGILITEVASGSVSYANPAAEQLLGISLEHLVGTPLDRHLQMPTDIDSAGQTMVPWNFVVIRALSEETVKTQETLVKRPDGSSVITLCSSAPLFSEKDVLTGAVLVFQDISAQKELEQLKNEFIAMASHELRSPITAIQGFAELLQTDDAQVHASATARRKRALQQIIKQSHHLTTLIEEMLDLTRIEQARFTMNRTPQNVFKILSDVVESFVMTNNDHHIQLKIEELETSQTFVSNLDEKRMVQVFSNVMSNAIKYSPVGSVIEVGLRATSKSYAPKEVLVWMKDRGIGIPASELPRIFQRFHRVGSLDPSINGLGIGLYLVKEIVNHHEGHVWVESIEGQGSTFYIQLPLASD